MNFEKIQQLHIQTEKLVQELFVGVWASCFKGQGMEFDSLREYYPGDAVKQIDWNVTARFNRPFIKNYQEERQLAITLVVDISSSTQFGPPRFSKHQRLAEIGALIAFSALKNHDKVGLLLFTDEVEHYLPPLTGSTHGLRVIRDLLYFRPTKRKTDVKTALTYFANVRKKRGIVFFLSDFLFPAEKNLWPPLTKRHDFIAISINDSLEMTFPSLGQVRLKDLESDIEGVYHPKTQNLSLEDLRSQHEKDIKKVGGSFLPVTQESYIEMLHKFLLLRRSPA